MKRDLIHKMCYETKKRIIFFSALPLIVFKSWLCQNWDRFLDLVRAYTYARNINSSLFLAM